MIQNSLVRKNKSLKKGRLKLIPARLTDSYPLHLAFVETAKYCYLNIYMSSFLRSNSAINQGVSSWLTLIKYLKQHIAFVDIEKIQTMIVDYGRSPVNGATDEKNRLLISMFLLLVSEKSLMVKTYLGGYTMKFLNSSLAAIKSKLEKSSSLYIESLQKRENLCAITYDKSLEIYFSKIRDHNGALETGEMWNESEQQLHKVTSRSNTLVEFESPGGFGPVKPYSFSKFDTPSFAPQGLIRKRSNKRKNSILVNEFAVKAANVVKNIIPQEEESAEKEDQSIDHEDEKDDRIPRGDQYFKSGRSRPLPFVPPLLNFDKLGNTGEHSNSEILPSARSLQSPVIKSRYNKISRPRSSLISMDELINLLEDNRTSLASIYTTRKENEFDLSSRRLLRKKLTSLTYPRIFRLNPIVATLVLRDKSLGLGKSFLILYFSIDLNDFSTLQCIVDIADRQIGFHQIGNSFSVKELASISRVKSGILEKAVEILQRGGRIPASVKLELISSLNKSVGRVYLRSRETRFSRYNAG